MNRAGVSVTINGAPSSLPRNTATPVAMVARDILQKAHNLAEALEIIRNAKVFVSTHWLVGSRADGKFVIVEKTPDACNVLESESNTIVSANHFQTAGLKDEERNTNYMSDATSVARFNRPSLKLAEAHGKIDAVTVSGNSSRSNFPAANLPGMVIAPRSML